MDVDAADSVPTWADPVDGTPPLDFGERDPQLPAWRRALVPAILLVVALAAAVAAGVWWAGRDQPAAAALADGGGGPTVSATDWTAVVRQLDARRAAAFAAGDPELLQQVYTVSAPGLIEDATRIRALNDGGLRVDGLVHVVSEVERTDQGDGGSPVLTVTDALPAAPIRDADGVVVGATVPVGSVRRVVGLETVAGQYRIASVTAGAG
jgi:hypothetical protein